MLLVNFELKLMSDTVKMILGHVLPKVEGAEIIARFNPQILEWFQNKKDIDRQP